MPLKRTLSLYLVTFYGIGTIIGAGIYALIGEVSKEAHRYTPFSFLIAAVIAVFTAASYAELSSRFPQSAGSALYVEKAFHKTWLSKIVGWLVAATGIISAATLARGFVNYFQIFSSLPFYIIIPLLIIFLGAITLWGINESAKTILWMTMIEIAGLLMIVWYGKFGFTQVISHWHQYIPNFQASIWSGIFIGAFMAFYAFIGFEDMVNLAEESKHAEKNIPLGILLALLSATLIYLLVSIVLVTTIPLNELIQSSVPLTLIIKNQGHSPILFILIALTAIMNGILVQIIMGSRLIYGMTRFKAAPQIFSYITKKTKIPLFSTLLILFLIIILALTLPLETLAKITSSIMLCVFSLMHLSLIVIKYHYPKMKKAIVLPKVLPFIGLATCLFFLLMGLRHG